MLAIAIIVFREVLEAALIVSIVMAASLGVPGRERWVAYGVAGGVAGASLVAACATTIAAAFEGIGQELLNAGILMLAVVMLGWHNIWMVRHGRELARMARSVTQAVTTGVRPLSALALITGAAVLREGSETVLFVYSVAAGGTDGPAAMISGAILGLGGGLVVGAGLYIGLLRIPAGRLFAATSWMILLLAAGLAAQCANFLMQADLLPPFGTDLWDSSALLSETSLLGKVLHTLVGYVARPTGMQVLAYVSTLLVIGGLMRLSGGRRQRNHVTLSAPVAVALLSCGLVGMASPARADFQIRSPLVEYRELEFEHNGSVTLDRNPQRNKDQSYTFSVGLGILPFWKLELEAETAAPPGTRLTYDATTIENTFQLTPQGKYWADLGLFVEYSHGAQRGSTNEIKLGPIVQKETPGFGGYPLLHTLNLFFTREVGPNSTTQTGFQPAWQSRVLLNPYFEPGIEIYGAIDDLSHAGKFNDQRYNVGPMFAGTVAFSGFGKLRYELGYLFGLTTASARGAVRWKLEYEIAF